MQYRNIGAYLLLTTWALSAALLSASSNCTFLSGIPFTATDKRVNSKPTSVERRQLLALAAAAVLPQPSGAPAVGVGGTPAVDEASQLSSDGLMNQQPAQRQQCKARSVCRLQQ